MSRARLLAAVLLLARPASAWALFGAGDIVFDPTETAQTINVLRETQQEFDRLGSILGVSTQQFDQLVALAAALGDAAEAAPFRQAATVAQMEAAVQAVPGLAGASLDGLFDAAGLLDAFLGVTPDQWQQAVENPLGFYRSALVDPAIARVGAAAGLDPPSVAYAQWYAALSPEDQRNLGSAAALDLSNLLAEDWLGGTQRRRVNLEGLSAASQDAAAKAGRAQTVLDQQQAQSQLGADTNSILLESAAQNAGAAEAAVRAAAAEGALLSDQNAARRDADELRLDSPP